MTIEELSDLIIKANELGMEVLTDNQGQIIIYTGIWEHYDEESGHTLYRLEPMKPMKDDCS